MGYMRHHALIATSMHEDSLRQVHAWAVDEADTLGMLPIVTPLIGPAINGYYSFAVLPDGSKEAWEPSDAGDELRRGIIDLIETYRYSDGSTPIDYVLVQFGDDAGRTTLLAHSDDGGGV